MVVFLNRNTFEHRIGEHGDKSILFHKENKEILYFQSGISGPLFYTVGAAINIAMFPIVSVYLKTRAPGAKTFLQVSFHSQVMGLISFQDYAKP